MSSMNRPSSAPAASSRWNLPNLLTVFRLVLVPIMVVFLLVQTPWSRWVALVVFVVAAYTDRLDGKLARQWKQVSDFGKIWDPIADKALTMSALMLMSWQYSSWLLLAFTLVVLVRELGITWLRSWLLRRQRVVAASFSGKAKTVSQMLLIFLLMIPWDTFAPVDSTIFTAVSVVAWIVAVAALFLAAYSAWGYLRIGRQQWHKEKAAK